MKITLSKNGLLKKVSTGFSWKLFLFGLLYPISRSDWKGLGIQLIALSLTFGLAFFVMIFTYNKSYIKRLIEDGYTPVDEYTKTWLYQKLGYQC